ncbi:MAG: hypothetical protein KDA99_22920, partial [Planctomycetales bacterium]|nr:hypothetical protein [Planctomycetales bacterium]
MTSLTVIVMAATVWVGAEAEPETADQFVDRGMQRFRAGEIAESLGDFDRAIEKEPRVRPYLWQRGISLYYLGKYAEGREQFETHRSVNPHDVENAAWHFLC